MPEKLAQFVKKELAGKKLIVVSNREPYIHKKTGLSIKIEKPAGGLTSAMDDVLKATGGNLGGLGQRERRHRCRRHPQPACRSA